MKYEPMQPPEGINVSDEHPLKSFFILSLGTIAIIIAIIITLGLVADSLVKYIPVEYEQGLFNQDGFYIMPFSPDESKQGIQVNLYIQNLVDELHATADKKYIDHKFNVVLTNESIANAFAVPGGHIVVTKGLLSSIQSENGLSMILAHEMAHHYERHPLRSTGRGIVVSLFLLTILGVDGSSFLQEFLGNTASITNLVFSRKQESEADMFAVELLRKFYGHASGATEFFHHIHAEEKDFSTLPNFLNTHPSTEGRIETLMAYETQYPGIKKSLPEILREYAHNIEYSN